jgi:hypothetical protein
MSMSIYINVSAYKLSSSLDIWDIHLFDVLNWDVANLPIPHWKMGSVFDFRTDLSLPSLFRDPSWCFGGISTLLEIKKFFGTKKTSHCGHHDNQSHSCGLRLSSVEGFLANVPQGNHTQVGGSFFSKSFDVAHQCVPRHCGIPTDSWLRLYPSHHPSIRGDLTGS